MPSSRRLRGYRRPIARERLALARMPRKTRRSDIVGQRGRRALYRDDRHAPRHRPRTGSGFGDPAPVSMGRGQAGTVEAPA